MGNLPGWTRTSVLYLPGVAPWPTGLQAETYFTLHPHKRATPVEGFEPSVSTFKAWRPTVDLHWKTLSYSVRESNSRYTLEEGAACH